MNPNQPLPFEPEFLVRQEPAKKPATRQPRQMTGPRTAVGAPGFLSVRAAAERLGLRPRSVIYLLQRGILSSQRLGRAHFLKAVDVERYLRVRRERALRGRERRARQTPRRLVR
jgi:hypothetical protein